MQKADHKKPSKITSIVVISSVYSASESFKPKLVS